MLRVCKTCNIKLNLDEKNEKNQTPFDVAWEAVDGETVLLLKKWGLTSEKHNLEDPNQWVFMPDDSIQACKASGVDSLALNLQEVFSFQPVKELRQTHGNRIFESKYELVKTLTGNFRLSKVFNATSLEQEDNFFPNMNLDQLFEFYTKFFNIRPKEYTHIKIQVDEKKGLATGIDLHQDSSLGDKFCEKVIIVYALNEGAHQKLDFVDLENLEVRSIPVENGTAICFDNRRYLHGVKAPQDSQQEICQRNLITFRFYR